MSIDRDAVLEIFVSEDGMSVYGTFLPPLGEGRPFTPEYVDAVLENGGILAGTLPDAISEAIFTCNTERRAQERVRIAEGREPQAARPAYWDVTVATVHGGPENEPDALRVDYKNETHYQVVYSGDKLAVLVPPSEGTAGVDVYGKEIPFPVEAVPRREPGANTKVEDDVAYAAVGGQLVVTDSDFRVEDHLLVSGDIGYGTGSIEFPGDVTVKGEIKEGFHIWAGGDITADRTVDVSEIYCKGSFSGAGGIIGRGKALLRAGGAVSVRFVGNCHVESKDSVKVTHYAYHARTGCLGTFSMEKGGRVIGGVITAARGITCATLGNAAGIPTLIRSGIDFIVERKLRINRERHQDITLRLQRLTERVGDDPSDRQLDILHKLEEERNKHALALGELTERLDVCEDAAIVVTGTVYPGVRIQICRAEYTVREVMKSVVFRLDKATGHVISSRLEGPRG
jgi:uncharacterized protein